jgi:antitoxin component YwqK of YwqJK toxin-antitoxin module
MGSFINNMKIAVVSLSFLCLLFSCSDKQEAIVKYYKDGTTNIYSPIDSDSLAHGLVTYFYPGGTKEVEIEYVHGEKHGNYRSYYKSSNLNEQGQYDKGKENGAFIEYYDDVGNNLKSKSHYIQGRQNGMYYFFRKNSDTTSYGYVENDTTRFYVLYDEKGSMEDHYSESAIIPKKKTLNVGDSYKVGFKVFGAQSETADINYFLINFENLDTIKEGGISNYKFNTVTSLVFTDLTEGRHFIDFKVPMLDSIFVINSFVTVGDIPDSTFHK